MMLLTLFIVVYFVNTCSTVNQRSLESVAYTKWITRSEKLIEFSAETAVLITNDDYYQFIFKEKEGYIFGYVDNIVTFEFTNYGDKLYCSTINEMFYNEAFL